MAFLPERGARLTRSAFLKSYSLTLRSQRVTAACGADRAVQPLRHALVVGGSGGNGIGQEPDRASSVSSPRIFLKARIFRKGVASEPNRGGTAFPIGDAHHKE
jgi:hypothetical protein